MIKEQFLPYYDIQLPELQDLRNSYYEKFIHNYNIPIFSRILNKHGEKLMWPTLEYLAWSIFYWKLKRVWLAVVGPPGSGKTMMITELQKMILKDSEDNFQHSLLLEYFLNLLRLCQVSPVGAFDFASVETNFVWFDKAFYFANKPKGKTSSAENYWFEETKWVKANSNLLQQHQEIDNKVTDNIQVNFAELVAIGPREKDRGRSYLNYLVQAGYNPFIIGMIGSMDLYNFTAMLRDDVLTWSSRIKSRVKAKYGIELAGFGNTKSDDEKIKFSIERMCPPGRVEIIQSEVRDYGVQKIRIATDEQRTELLDDLKIIHHPAFSDNYQFHVLFGMAWFLKNSVRLPTSHFDIGFNSLQRLDKSGTLVYDLKMLVPGEK